MGDQSADGKAAGDFEHALPLDVCLLGWTQQIGEWGARLKAHRKRAVRIRAALMAGFIARRMRMESGYLPIVDPRHLLWH